MWLILLKYGIKYYLLRFHPNCEVDFERLTMLPLMGVTGFYIQIYIHTNLNLD